MYGFGLERFFVDVTLCLGLCRTFYGVFGGESYSAFEGSMRFLNKGSTLLLERFLTSRATCSLALEGSRARCLRTRRTEGKEPCISTPKYGRLKDHSQSIFPQVLAGSRPWPRSLPPSQSWNMGFWRVGTFASG